ncbi:16S rRNA processing protein RimM [bacterium]|nr:MAG: 16S rRNA processing protein RimM [bacterium]
MSVRIGRIAGAHGLKGQLKIDPLTDFWERFDKGCTLILQGKEYEVEASQVHKGRPLIKLRGIDTIDQAEKLQWEYLESDEARPDLEEDEFLTDDLIGLTVFDQNGLQLGKVDDILSTPAHDILVIGEIMVPAIKEFVDDVDLEAETIKVRLIPGMRPGEAS